MHASTRSTPIASTHSTSTTSSSSSSSRSSSSSNPSRNQHMRDVRHRQQEEQSKAQQADFDSLFDDQHVFGIPYNVGNRRDSYNEPSTTTASSSRDWGKIRRVIFFRPSVQRSRTMRTIHLVKTAPIILQPTRTKIAILMLRATSINYAKKGRTKMAILMLRATSINYPGF